MGEYGTSTHARVTAFIELVSAADPATVVPTCPAWTVKDTLAHVAGVAADILAGNLEGAPGDPWTAAQVDVRRDKTVDEIVGEGEPAATVKASRFEIMRAFSGRRSPTQIAALDWSGDPAPFIPMFASGPFTFPPNDIVE